MGDIPKVKIGDRILIDGYDSECTVTELGGRLAGATGIDDGWVRVDTPEGESRTASESEIVTILGKETTGG